MAHAPDRISRRAALAGAATATAATLVQHSARAAQSQTGTAPTDNSPGAGEATAPVNAKEGRIQQSVCKWCFPNLSLDEMSAVAVNLGLVGIDLLGPADFPTLKKHGLVCTMVTSHPLDKGLCDPQFHEMALEKITAAVEATSAEGWKNVIVFSGNGRGIDPQTGMKNCVDALQKVVPLAEEKNVTLQMELLNSKVDHPDYMCDNSDWGVELCKRVGSDNFKLLYDIYHMQIMEGDIIRTIRNNHQYFGHYHTAGNPGRHELDEDQELRYPPIARAIADTGFNGYLAHEFIPQGDPIAGLTNAVRKCTV